MIKTHAATDINMIQSNVISGVIGYQFYKNFFNDNLLFGPYCGLWFGM